MIKRSAWGKIGKFPEVVSEDFAFSMRAASFRFKSKYIDSVGSFETFPYDFGGFIIRLKKFASGTAELFRKEFLGFLLGSAYLTEKWDFVMMLLWYLIMPLVTINGFLGAYVSHIFWANGIPYIHTFLPYLYVWMIFMILVIIISVDRKYCSPFKFYLWATAIYTTAMPIAGLAFIKGLLIKPSFNRTPKNQEKGKLGKVESAFMFILGLAALSCSKIWVSPFSPFLIGQGIAYTTFPLFNYLCHDNVLGRLSRIVINMPGIFMIIALFVLWYWER